MTIVLRLIVGLALFWSNSTAVPPAAADPRQWPLDFLHIAQAQQVSQGAGITVAVIDTGVDAGHPDLSGSVLPGADLVTTGSTRDARTDLSGHGTGMAGLIAGHGRMLGVAPRASIVPIRVLTEFGRGTAAPDLLAQAIDLAVVGCIDGDSRRKRRHYARFERQRRRCCGGRQYNRELID